jgi:hypothetical protein
MEAQLASHYTKSPPLGPRWLRHPVPGLGGGRDLGHSQPGPSPEVSA